MRTLEVFNARAFRLALAFSAAISIATAAAFAFIYWQVSSADTAQVAAVLVDEAAMSQGESEAELRGALRLRLTRDLQQLDFVALFDPKGEFLFGNVPRMPPVPIDGRAHVVQERLSPDSTRIREPAVFVVRRLADGDALLLGRSLWDVYALRQTLLRALAITLPPTILVILAIGAFFARRASRRFDRIHDAIVRIMNGELDSRLPVANEDSDIDKVARAVNLMLDEIARLLEQLKSAGDSIAHDLRTPLAVARARIERTLDSGADIEGLRAGLEAALAQIEKMSATISAILRISAVENDGRKTQFKDFDLADVCSQLVDFYEPLAESKGLTMIADAARPVPIRGDPGLLREALANLIDNAIKFTPAGGAVRIEARMADGRPYLSVSDTGPGVPPEERERIFDRLYRGGRSGQSPGHGLGLSIAKSIAALHGFSLTVADNNPGARFELRPAAPAPAALENEIA